MHNLLLSRIRLAMLLFTVLFISACSSFAYSNRPQSSASAVPVRASLAVDGKRGDPKTLMFLAMSGGGSRASYLSLTTMQRLQNLYPDRDLLKEVDAMSSVSGGSVAAAYYVATRDESASLPVLHKQLSSLPATDPLLQTFVITNEQSLVRCKVALDEVNIARLQTELHIPASEIEQSRSLCLQSSLTKLRGWETKSAREDMTKNFLLRWIGNWFWPSNIGKYWFSAFDRTDIMAQTLADNLYDSGLTGVDLSIADLNPTRPYLVINATNATNQWYANKEAAYPFGSVFTFTDTDFSNRLHSSIAEYEVARAVMASAAFPAAFQYMTLRDYHAKDPDRYLHVFDGGNADNLGVTSIKRILLQMQVENKLKEYDRVIVILIDAYTRPKGKLSDDPKPSSWLDLLVDTNFVDAVDSLLQANRSNLLADFRERKLRWAEDCGDEDRQLPESLCSELNRRFADDKRDGIDMADKLVFYHVGFDDVMCNKSNKSDVSDGSCDSASRTRLKRKLDDIPTSFRITDENVGYIDQAVDIVLTPQNQCLQAIHDLIAQAKSGAEAINSTQFACDREEHFDRQEYNKTRRK